MMAMIKGQPKKEGGRPKTAGDDEQHRRVVREEGGGRMAKDRMINSKQTSDNQPHAMAMRGGGDGRRWMKTMTMAAIAVAMAEEATGLWRLRQLHGGNRAGANS